jgi:hypothetical protein
MTGGASSGYCDTAIVGMEMAPARMMTSEQTDARMGRLMKVLTNMCQSSLSALRSPLTARR